LGMGPKKEDRTLSKEVFHLAEKQTWLKPVQSVVCPFFWSLFFGIFDENAWHTLANWSVMVSCLFLFLIDTEQKTLFLP